MNIKGAVRHLGFLIVYHLYAKRKLTRTDHISLFGFDFEVPPSVFHPGLFFSSGLLGRYVLAQELSGKQVLDLGCGSGVLSILAASRGASVTAVDINPAAAGATERNALTNSVERHVSVSTGNLFQTVPDALKYDVILINPPFYQGIPENAADHAWRGGIDFSYLRHFSRGAKGHLNDEGRIILIVSSDMDIASVNSVFSEDGYDVRSVFRKKVFFEVFYILEISPLP